MYLIFCKDVFDFFSQVIQIRALITICFVRHFNEFRYHIMVNLEDRVENRHGFSRANFWYSVTRLRDECAVFVFGWSGNGVSIWNVVAYELRQRTVHGTGHTQRVIEGEWERESEGNNPRQLVCRCCCANLPQTILSRLYILLY